MGWGGTFVIRESPPPIRPSGWVVDGWGGGMTGGDTLGIRESPLPIRLGGRWGGYVEIFKPPQTTYLQTDQRRSPAKDERRFHRQAKKIKRGFHKQRDKEGFAQETKTISHTKRQKTTNLQQISCILVGKLGHLLHPRPRIA